MERHHPSNARPGFHTQITETLVRYLREQPCKTAIISFRPGLAGTLFLLFRGRYDRIRQACFSIWVKALLSKFINDLRRKLIFLKKAPAVFLTAKGQQFCGKVLFCQRFPGHNTAMGRCADLENPIGQLLSSLHNTPRGVVPNFNSPWRQFGR